MPLSEEPPDPGCAATPADLVSALRLLKIWAGGTSYDAIRKRINSAWTAAGRPPGELVCRSTVAYCFQPGRRRLDAGLVLAIVEALHPDPAYHARWRTALRVIDGEIEAATRVSVHDALPHRTGVFTGRDAELAILDRTPRAGTASPIFVIEGMAGVGKTRLAVHAGHRLMQRDALDRILFVDLRGFDPDPRRPPADPGAVLDGFLHLLGMPGRRIPHGLDGRVRAYRERLAGTRTLVVLDNAAGIAQVRPLLPATPGSLTLVTSRRGLAGLPGATPVRVGVFTGDEAAAFLRDILKDIPVGTDPEAAARIARRCGNLPLALALIAAHIHGTPGWTLTDHADRLDERHRDRLLDTEIALALDVSYQRLPAERRRLLRLVALHPGQDIDADAAGVLAGTAAVRDHLDALHRDHLLQQTTPHRYGLHDLVRAHALGRAQDEDRPADRRAALTRLFDHYLATARAAADLLYPADAQLRPRSMPSPAATPSGPDAARAWLDTERPTLIAVAAHAAAHDWPAHTTGLSIVLGRYLTSGHPADALAMYAHARRAARQLDDLPLRAHALTDLGIACRQQNRYGPALAYLREALRLHRRTGDRAGEARVLSGLGEVAVRQGAYRSAVRHLSRYLDLCRQLGDRVVEVTALTNLGSAQMRLGRHRAALDAFRQALHRSRETGNRIDEAYALTGLGTAELWLGRHESATGHLRRALPLSRAAGDRVGVAVALNSLGACHAHLGRPSEAVDCHQRALRVFREFGERSGEAWALLGLGNVSPPADALGHFRAALDVATDIDAGHHQLLAHTGLSRAHHATGNPSLAHHHDERARHLSTLLRLPESDGLHARVGAVAQQASRHAV